MKYSIYIILAATLLCSSSCKKWIDVDPRSVIKEEEMFEDARGFKSALVGVYTKMASRDLYGANLTIGFADVLAQYYSVESNQHSFYLYSTYNDQARAIPDAIWKNAYNAIANCNNILQHLEGKEAMFWNGEYDLIKAEATALRAFLHLDLLRLYAPSFTKNPAAKAIPYVNKVSRIPFPQLTVTETLDAIIADLESAAAVLKETDPWSEYYKGIAGPTTQLPEFFTFRMERMNFYAVLGTLARASLYKGDKVKANEYATEVLRTKKTGVLFTLFSDKSWDNGDLYFNSQASANSKLIVPAGRKLEYYETAKYGSLDLRYKDWFKYYPGSNEEFMAKYMRSVPQSGNPPTVTLIRTEEMSYIKAECAATETEAVNELNIIRLRYGLTNANKLVAGLCVVEDEIFKEYRKTFIGEGQLFFYLKRKNMDPIPYSLVEDVQKAYVLRIPDLEIEFGSINK